MPHWRQSTLMITSGCFIAQILKCSKECKCTRWESKSASLLAFRSTQMIHQTRIRPPFAKVNCHLSKTWPGNFLSLQAMQADMSMKAISCGNRSWCCTWRNDILWPWICILPQVAAASMAKTSKKQNTSYHWHLAHSAISNSALSHLVIEKATRMSRPVPWLELLWPTGRQSTSWLPIRSLLYSRDVLYLNF